MSTISQGELYESTPAETAVQPAVHGEPTSRTVIATLAGGVQ